MQPTSELYKRLYAEEHRIEARIVIEDGTIDSGITESEIFSLSIHHALFDGETPKPGCTVAGEIDIKMLSGNRVIPRMAKLTPYVRLVSADGTEHSEWLKKGEYFIDTREITQDDGLNILTIHGYDAMLKTQADYPSDNAALYPASDIEIAEKIAAAIGVELDPRTEEIMIGSYQYGLPVGYAMQEVLSSIAMPYLGSWIISDDGKLRLVAFTDVPKETRLLTDHVGYRIVFGTEDGTEEGEPVRILV